MRAFGRIIGSVICTMAIAGCATDFSARGLPVNDRSDDAPGKLQGRPVFGRPILLGQSDPVMVPFAIETDSDVFKDLSWGISGSMFSSSGSYMGLGSAAAFRDYFYDSSIHWNNVVFYDKHSGSLRLLLDRKAVISSFYWPSTRSEDVANGSSPKANYLLFGVTERDTNGDRIINRNDEIILIMTDLAGLNPISLTPAGTQLDSINSDDGGGSLYIRVIHDSDADRKFTRKDQSSILRVDTTKPGVGQPILSDEIRQQAIDAIVR